MVSKAQLRILAWLSKQPDSLEKSWDVSREISLPGIAEGIGVVRSALNIPLTKLEQDGLISKRMAHVIGGGNRRRQVYHITGSGRAQISESEVQSPERDRLYKIYGNPPNASEIFGRRYETVQCQEILLKNSLLVTGMPGIGKSAFVLNLCQELASKFQIRWATAEYFSDYHSIASSWYPENPVPKDLDAICHMIESYKVILVIDDVNLVSERHIENVRELVDKLTKIEDIRIILLSRERSDSFGHFENFKLDALDLESCCNMLGEHLSLTEREGVVSSLGNHPLALKLYRPEYEIPESSKDVIEYVENVVLRALSDDQKHVVSRLSLEPKMMNVENSIAVNDIDLLDEQNLLRWNNTNLFELQHLVRNVTRNNLAPDERKDSHRFLAEHWQLQDTDGAFESYLYHLSQSNLTEFIIQLSTEINSLNNRDTAAIATIVADCLNENETNSELIYLETKIAALRFEPSIIRKNLPSLTNDRLMEMEFCLAQIEGKVAEYESELGELLKQKSPLEGARILMSLASQVLEDRLPSAPITEESRNKVEHYLKQIRLKDIEHGRQSITVAMSILKHSIAVADFDFALAEDIIQSLIGVGSIDDTIILNLRTKEVIAKYLSQLMTIEEVGELVDANCHKMANTFMSDSLKLRYIELLLEDNIEGAKMRFAQLTKPEEFSRTNTSIRYSARWWLLHSKIHQNTAKSSLQEALVRYREAGCVKASAKLEKLFHAQF